MNVTRAVAVQQTVDVLPTPQSPREDPFGPSGSRSPGRRPPLQTRDSDVLRAAYRAIRNAQPAPESADKRASVSSSTASQPRWLRKVRAWLAGTWGLGHKRKTS